MPSDAAASNCHTWTCVAYVFGYDKAMHMCRSEIRPPEVEAWNGNTAEVPWAIASDET